MKYLFSIVFTVVILGLVAFKTKEEVKSQSEHIKNFEPATYTAYLTAQNGDKYAGGIEESAFGIKEILPEKNQPNDHFQVMIGFGKTATSDAYSYLPDNPAFPITYMQEVYEGNAKMQSEKGYVMRNNPLSRKKRIVFLDDLIYVIEDWKDKDNYKLKYVLEKGNPPSGLKAMKVVLQSPKKMAALEPHKKLQAYLDAAYAKQQEVYPKWKTDNAALVAKLEGRAADYSKAISDQASMYLKNMTGRDIYIYWGDSNTAGVLPAGQTKNYRCGSEYFYDFTGKRFYYPNEVIRITRAGDNSKCVDQIGEEPYEIR